MSSLKEIELPVYKTSYDLLLDSFKLIKGINREYKYTIGEKTKNEITSLLMNVYRGNKTSDSKRKIIRVEEAIENIEVIRLLFRLLYDLHQISMNAYVNVNVKIENVRRQLNGWLKKLKA